MASLINDLIDILNKQTVHYDELLILSTEKKNVIIRNDIDTLQKMTTVENKIIGRNQKLEVRRLDIMKNIANVLNKDAEALTISALAELIKGQEEYGELVELKDKLKKIVTDLKDVNDINNELLQSSIDYIDFSFNLIRSSLSDKTSSYRSNKSDDYSEEKGFFDAKQ